MPYYNCGQGHAMFIPEIKKDKMENDLNYEGNYDGMAFPVDKQIADYRE